MILKVFIFLLPGLWEAIPGLIQAATEGEEALQVALGDAELDAELAGALEVAPA